MTEHPHRDRPDTDTDADDHETRWEPGAALRAVAELLTHAHTLAAARRHRSGSGIDPVTASAELAAASRRIVAELPPTALALVVSALAGHVATAIRAHAAAAADDPDGTATLRRLCVRLSAMANRVDELADDGTVR